MVVARQRGDMGATGLALLRIADHDNVRDTQGHTHRLGRTGVNLVVQRNALRMLVNPQQRLLPA
jgi:hypothetical protein